MQAYCFRFNFIFVTAIIFVKIGMKVAKDRGDEFYDFARKDNILGRNRTRLELWEEHLKDHITVWEVSRLIVGWRL